MSRLGPGETVRLACPKVTHLYLSPVLRFQRFIYGGRGRRGERESQVDSQPLVGLVLTPGDHDLS